MDALRKVYHRAVQIPLGNVERLWQELEAFETNLNRITTKKIMADLSPAHMQARTVLRQLVNHVGAIYPPNTPKIFLPSLPRSDTSERALVGKWKAYLKWEESNPLEIEEKDRATLITHIRGVYRKAVIRMRYYTEIWYRIYCCFPLVLLTLYLSSGSRTNCVGRYDEAMSILKAGMEANPSR
jgi:cleavage stimulation factor subunit 3